MRLVSFQLCYLILVKILQNRSNHNSSGCIQVNCLFHLYDLAMLFTILSLLRRSSDLLFKSLSVHFDFQAVRLLFPLFA